MTTYLVVANQTAISTELSNALLAQTEQDNRAEFILVVPATPVDNLLTHEAGQARQIAARRAGRALTQLTDMGVPIVGAHVGGASVLQAIEDAMRERVVKYDGIILSTFPEGTSRWLEEDLLNRLDRAFHLPVNHVISTPAEHINQARIA